MNMKLIWSILVLVPILGSILYILMEKSASKNERLIALLALIPGVNLICAIILVLSALGIVNL